MSTKKKDKLSKMPLLEALGYLKSRFVNFLKGVEPYPLKGVEIDYRNSDGTFRPSDASVRAVFIDCERKWRHYINSTIPEEHRGTFQNAFKKEIEATWSRSKQVTDKTEKGKKNQF